MPVERERPIGSLDLDGHDAVLDRRPVGDGRRHRKRRRRPRRPPEPGHAVDVREHGARRWLQDAHVHWRVGVRPRPLEHVGLDVVEHQRRPQAGVRVQCDPQPVVVFVDVDAVDERAVVDLLAAQRRQQHRQLVERWAEVGQDRAPLAQHLCAGDRSLARHVELHDAAAPARRRVDDDDAGLGHRRRQRPPGAVRQALADLARLRVAMHHGATHLVDRARAHRVVGRVADELQPRRLQQRLRPGGGRQEERAQGLGQSFDRSLGSRCGLLDVDAVRRHAHQHVGPRSRSQLAGPRRQPLDRRVHEVLGQ